MKLDSNNHSVFSLNYHLILCIKYRRKVLTDEISEYAKSVFERIGSNYRIAISEWNHDHIHVLFMAHPTRNYPILRVKGRR
ncbi:IS200/IS605 family transposase [Paenibacillus oralis]|uniref:IS200/IS605 family transposase n=1 Tax=Paenibacillus oralis TaxID=2490856 RepID=A0A3P3TAA6_9BACL|nr:IS200/IS605 family transposase [Paenibacillus oralis]